MTLAQTAAEVLREYVVLECESIDRMYLNVYVPQLQSVGGVVGYLHAQHGQRLASTVAVAPMTEAFVKSIERFARDHHVEVVSFAKGQRKDDITQQYLARFQGTEGVLYIGKAQEKASPSGMSPFSRVSSMPRSKLCSSPPLPSQVPVAALSTPPRGRSESLIQLSGYLAAERALGFPPCQPGSRWHHRPTVPADSANATTPGRSR